jgi:hypothetical protein
MASITYERIFLSKGGLGLGSAHSTAIPAYLGSVALGARIIEKAVSAFLPTAVVSYTELLDIRAHINALEITGTTRKKIPDIFDPSQQPRRGIQKTINKLVKSEATERVLKKLCKAVERKPLHGKDLRVQRFVSSAQTCGPWMYANVKFKQHTLSDDQTRDAISMRIGIPPALKTTCSYCLKPIPKDSVESHGFGSCALVARSQAGSIIKKAYRTCCSMLGLQPSISEPTLSDQLSWIPKGEITTESRADITVTCSGRKVLIDPTFVTRLDSTEARRLKPCISAIQAEQSKIAKYSENWTFPKGGFIPAAFEAHGAWGPNARTFLWDAYQNLKCTDHLFDRQLWNHITQLMSIEICKANTLLLDVARYAKRSSSRQPQQELDNNKNTHMGTSDMPGLMHHRNEQIHPPSYGTNEQTQVIRRHDVSPRGNADGADMLSNPYVTSTLNNNSDGSSGVEGTLVPSGECC